MLYDILRTRVSTIKGIFNVGSNTGQEVPIFKQFTNNIVLVEPVLQLVDYLKNHFSDCIIVPYALGSTSEVKPIYVASNNYESSSLLKPKEHIACYPGITFAEGPMIVVKTFKDIEQEFCINLENYNVLITDTQGFDLEVLKGFESNIKRFDLIICEYINVEYYENNSSLNQIIEYLSKFNFNFNGIFDYDSRSGNAIFTK